MRSAEQELKYAKAKDRVKNIRSFYFHLLTFILIVSLYWLLPFFGISFCIICVFDNTLYNFLISFFPWLFLLGFHGLSAFGKIGFLKRWEEKKLKQFMDE